MSEQRFESLLKQYRDPLYRQALAMLADADEAQDVVQEVYLRLWGRLDRVDVATERAWLAQVCRNRCLDLLRRRKVRQVARDDRPDPRRGFLLVSEDANEVELEVSDLGAAARQAEMAPDLERMVEAMQQLKEPWRSIVLLREIHDLPYEQIATQLELSLSAVKVYLHRARKELQRQFDGERQGKARA